MSLEAACESESEFPITDSVVVKEEKIEADVVEVPLQVFQVNVVEAEFEGPPVKEERCLDNEGSSKAGPNPEFAQFKPGLKLEPVFEVLEEPVPECVQKFTADLSGLPKVKKSSIKHCDPKWCLFRRVHQILKTSSPVQASCRICRKPAKTKSNLCPVCERKEAIRVLGTLYVQEEALLVALKKSKSTRIHTESLNPPIRDCWVQLQRCEAAERALGRMSNSTNIGFTQTSQPREKIAKRSSGSIDTPWRTWTHRIASKLQGNEKNVTEKKYQCEMRKAKFNRAKQYCQAWKEPSLNLDLNCWVRIERCEAAERALKLKLSATRNQLFSVRKTTVVKCKKGKAKGMILVKSDLSEKSYDCKICKSKHNGVRQFCDGCTRVLLNQD